MNITSKQLEEWRACSDGKDDFSKEFPTGTCSYAELYRTCFKNKKVNYLAWVEGKIFSNGLADAAFWSEQISLVKENTMPDGFDEGENSSSERSARIGSSGYYAQIGSSGENAQIGSSGENARIGSSGENARIGSSGENARIGSSGYYAQIGSSGENARIGSSGYSAQIGSSGDYAQIGSSGDRARIGSSGDLARIGSSGENARIGSSGYYAQIGATGENAVVASAGCDLLKIILGEGGACAVAYKDSNGKTRFAVGYVGEGLKAGVPYKVNSNGEFIKLTDSY